jgi:periplasmic mercuric ion binding protein
MKGTIVSLLAVGLLAVGVLGAVSCSTETEANVTEIKLPTIQCGMCVKTISAALEKADGVQKVNVDLDKKLATVTYASDKTGVKKLEQAVAKAGYAANTTKADAAAYEKLASCCKVGDGSH